MARDKLGERQTPQREAILRVISSAPGPITIEQIHEHSKKSQKNIGVATVYRTVKLLLDSGRIQPIILPDGQTRYETVNPEHHHHFRCRECDRVFDLPDEIVEELEKITLPNGLVVEEHELTLLGTCPQCNISKNTNS